ncbi:MAG: hypothetical protein ABJE95_21950 [Byssovorax sp.]
MLRNRFDQAVKDLCRESLEPDGTFESDAESTPSTQRIDGWFAPDPSREPTRNRLGLFGRITQDACTLEPFHATPDGEQVGECIRKLWNFRHVLSVRRSAPALPRLWILSSGRPQSGIDGFGFGSAEGIAPGVYLAPPRLFTGLVVISELPATRETLLLRLMGAGRTLQRAIAELRALPTNAPESAIVLPVLLRYRLDVPADLAKRTSDDEEFLMSTHEIVEAWKREQRQAGITEGRQEGRQEALLDLCEARFGGLTEDLAAVVRATHDDATLREWLRLAGTGTVDDLTVRLRSHRAS